MARRIDRGLDETLKIPEGVRRHALRAAKVILGVLKKNHALCTDGCRLLHKPSDWKPLFGPVADGALLVVAYESGEAKPFFDHRSGDGPWRAEAMRDALSAAGFTIVYISGCACVIRRAEQPRPSLITARHGPPAPPAAGAIDEAERQRAFERLVRAALRGELGPMPHAIASAFLDLFRLATNDSPMDVFGRTAAPPTTPAGAASGDTK